SQKPQDPGRKSSLGHPEFGGSKGLPETGGGVAEALFVGVYDLVESGVQSCVNLFSGGIGAKPSQGLADALGERRGGAIAGDEALDLGVVEYHAHRLVPNEAALVFR